MTLSEEESLLKIKDKLEESLIIKMQKVKNESCFSPFMEGNITSR